jgi:hypothetical protein
MLDGWKLYQTSCGKTFHVGWVETIPTRMWEELAPILHGNSSQRTAGRVATGWVKTLPTSMWVEFPPILHENSAHMPVGIFSI